MSNLKKISALTCATLLFITAGAVSAVDTRAMEIPQEVGEKEATLPTAEWTCLSNVEYEMPALWKKLKTAFIKNPMQRIIQVCMYNNTVYVIMEEEQKNGDRLTRGALYLLDTNKKYVERKGHRIMSFCELLDTSKAKNLRVNYLCYSPQVAAAYSPGAEWSFRIAKAKRRTYQRDCTVFFSGAEKKECKKWKRVK